jgi:hypothetical protein
MMHLNREEREARKEELVNFKDSRITSPKSSEHFCSRPEPETSESGSLCALCGLSGEMFGFIGW